MMGVKLMDIMFRKFEKNDIDKFEYWYTDCTDWQKWDAPWEWVNYNFDRESQFEKRMKKTNSEPCFEYEIIYNNEHIGWISAYYMTNDFKWNGLTYTDKIAIGIDIPDTKYRGLGIGTQVYKKYLEYFRALGYKEIHTQTWSGNAPMIKLAMSSGFKEVNRFVNLRIVGGKSYDALTFAINL